MVSQYLPCKFPSDIQISSACEKYPILLSRRNRSVCYDVQHSWLQQQSPCLETHSTSVNRSGSLGHFLSLLAGLGSSVHFQILAFDLTIGKIQFVLALQCQSKKRKGRISIVAKIYTPVQNSADLQSLPNNLTNIVSTEPVVLQKPALQHKLMRHISVQSFFTLGFSAVSLLFNQLFQKDKKFTQSSALIRR